MKPHFPPATLRLWVPRRELAFVAVGLAMALLSACGFHLRGHAPLPPAMSKVQLVLPDPNGELGRVLQPLLRANGATLVEQPEDDAAVLRVLEERMDREILSVSRQARVSEYRLRYRVRFEVVSTGGDDLVPARTLEVSQGYTFNEGAVLGKQREAALISQDLYQQMANLILMRISAATGHD